MIRQLFGLQPGDKPRCIYKPSSSELHEWGDWSPTEHTDGVLEVRFCIVCGKMQRGEYFADITLESIKGLHEREMADPGKESGEKDD